MDKKQLTLGGGLIYRNLIDIGALDGAVTLIYEGETVPFTPNNMLGPVRHFKVSEAVRLTASMAEINGPNFRLAMGQDTALVSSSSFPAYDPTSFVPGATASYDVQHFGGDTCINETSLRFEHTRPCDEDGNQYKIIVVLYKAVSNFNLNLPFDRTTQTFQEVEFTALADASRSAGDQMGFIATQVL